MNSSQSSPVTPVGGPPVTSLKDLREFHSALLQRTRPSKGEDSPPSPGEMLGLVQRIHEFGASLEDLDSREIAQGMLDLWVGRLLSIAPQAVDQGSHFVLADYHPAATAEVEQAAADEQDRLKKVYKDGNRFVGNLSSEDRRSLNRLLLGLFRLKEASTEPYPNPVAVDDKLLADPRTKALADKLAEMGVLQKRTLESGGEVIELASPQLLVRWNPLQEMVVNRRSLRQLALGWESSGKNADALLGGGEKYKQALNYPDLSEVERHFIDASGVANEARQKKEKDRMHRLVFGLATGLIVAVGLLLWALHAWTEVRIQKEKADLALREAEAQKEEAQKQRDEARIQKEKAERERSEWLFAQENFQHAKDEAALAQKQYLSLERKMSAELDRLRLSVQKAETSPEEAAAEVAQVKDVIAAEVKSQQTAVIEPPAPPKDLEDGKFMVRGPAFVLKPQADPLVKPDESLALIRKRSEVPTEIFIQSPNAKPSDKPMANQLNPEALWVIARWNYRLTNRQWLLGRKATLVNLRNSKQIEAQPVDWGNRAGYTMNISPAVAKQLDMKAGDEIKVLLDVPPPPPPAAE